MRVALNMNDGVVSLNRIIFNGNGCHNAEDTVNKARAANYPMFSFNGNVYAVPAENKSWDSIPLCFTVHNIS